MADFNIAYKEKISSLKLNKKTQDIVGKNVFLGEPTIQINKGTYTENVSLQATFEISDTKMIITGCLITISEQESYSALITKEAPVAAIVYEYGEENKIYMSGFESEESLPVNALLVGKIDFSDEGNLKEDFKYILTLSDLDTELKTYIKDIGLTEEASVPSDVSIQVTKGNGDKETINFPKATAQKDGLLSSEDKSKLDSIAEGANKYTHPNSGVTAGTYRSVTVNAQGHVTKGTNPTTLDGYGIKQVEAEKITGIIGLDNLPQGALERCVVVKNDEARFALTSDDVQTGDTVKVESTGLMYFIKDDTKLSSEEGYEVYTAGSATSVPWSGITGKPETFTPSEHTHTKDEITDFPDIDTTPTSDSDSLITSGGVYEALSDKADKNHTHPDATEEASGFMSAQDKMTMGMLPNYVVCDTASDVAVKDITLPGFDKKQEYPAFILYLKNGNTSGTVLKFRVNGADEITAQYNNDESNIVNLNSGWYVFTYAYGNSDRFDLLGAVSTTGISYHSDDDIFLNYGLVAVNTGGLELYQGILNHRSDNGFRHIPSNGETGQILANAGTGSAKWQTPDSAPTSGSSNVVTSDGVYAAMQATEIVANTDLNDVDDEGYYWCPSNKTASVTNKPEDAYIPFFGLRVTKISSNVFSQELVTAENQKFIRIYWAGSWGEWEKFATESDIPSELPNPNSLTISLNGASQGNYDGSTTKSINITAQSIGAADADHTHSTDDITSGVLPIERGGTGASTASGARSALGLGSAALKDYGTNISSSSIHKDDLVSAGTIYDFISKIFGGFRIIKNSWNTCGVGSQLEYLNFGGISAQTINTSYHIYQSGLGTFISGTDTTYFDAAFYNAMYAGESYRDAISTCLNEPSQELKNAIENTISEYFGIKSSGHEDMDGGTILLENGEYPLTHNIVIDRNNITIKGSDRTTIVTFDIINELSEFFSINGNNITFENITFRDFKWEYNNDTIFGKCSDLDRAATFNVSGNNFKVINCKFISEKSYNSVTHIKGNIPQNGIARIINCNFEYGSSIVNRSDNDSNDKIVLINNFSNASGNYTFTK